MKNYQVAVALRLNRQFHNSERSSRSAIKVPPQNLTRSYNSAHSLTLREVCCFTDARIEQKKVRPKAPIERPSSYCLPPEAQPGILSGNCPTMDNFSIQISSNLVNKLVEDAEKSKRKPRRTKKATRERPQPQAKITQKQGSDDSETLKGPGAKGWPFQSPLFVPVTPPSQSPYEELDAIRSVLQESERVVEQLQKQEENMLQEVTQKAKELRDKEFKLPFQKPMPCSNEKDACLSCYKEHADNPLKCAGVVTSFENCARRIRQQVGSAEK
ncbi:hypothetical protein ACFX13_033011 [Malus domestica]